MTGRTRESAKATIYPARSASPYLETGGKEPGEVGIGSYPRRPAKLTMAEATIVIE